MAQIIKIQANPKILTWAREEAGYSIEELSNKLGITVNRFKNWEKDGKEIPFGMLKKIANYYKRQIAVFFLPTVPEKIKKPKDYRNLAYVTENLSSDTLLAIRRTFKYIELAKDILGIKYWENSYSWENNLKNILEKNSKINRQPVISWLRQVLEIDINEQRKFGNDYAKSYNKWRNIIETKLGIFIFQFSMPIEELDGFSYVLDNYPKAIIINSNALPQRKIFTLFHELGHILKNQSALCITDIENDRNNLEIEYECNSFAGMFLVPDNKIYPISNENELNILAKELSVSREVYLRQSFEKGLISKRMFFELLKQIRKKTILKRNKINGGIPPKIKSKSSRGEMFYNLVLSAAYNSQIDFSTASDVLKLKVNYILNE
jgi:Zn-dependent peptidase ImmA (M78 family)